MFFTDQLTSHKKPTLFISQVSNSLCENFHVLNKTKKTSVPDGICIHRDCSAISKNINRREQRHMSMKPKGTSMSFFFFFSSLERGKKFLFFLQGQDLDIDLSIYLFIFPESTEQFTDVIPHQLLQTCSWNFPEP